MNKALYFLSFAVGAVTGGLISWRVTKKKMSKIVDDELASIHKIYSKDAAAEKLKSITPEKPDTKEYIRQMKQSEEYEQKVRDMEYKNPIEDKGPVSGEVKKYTIPPEQFAELSDYGTETLYFYKDGYLVDENEDTLTKEDIEKYIGFESLNTFGEYDDDVVYVRNDIMKRDFEIILEESNWEDIPKPDPVEVK